MTEYNQHTPITAELLEGAIALELLHRPVDYERIARYLDALQDIEATEDGFFRDGHSNPRLKAQHASLPLR